MNAGVPWTTTSGEAFGVDWLLAAIAPASSFGRRASSHERAFRAGDEAAARAALERVVAVASRVDPSRLSGLRAEIAGAPDPGAASVRARNGGVLGDPDFFEISRFLDAQTEVAKLVRDLGDELACAAPDAALRAALALGRTPARTFYLDDAFDPALAAARAESARRQAAYDAIRSRLAERAAAYAGVDAIRDGEFVVMRERLTRPVPSEIRVVREAPTYVLCELALDDGALAALAARDAALTRVADAEEGVRARLSAQVSSAAVALERACERLGEIDALVARAQFALRFKCVMPEITTAAPLAFEDARYLPLAEALARHGREYAPISLELSGVGVVTGPNMGGKSAALRTAAFIVACVALGVPVPAVVARVPLVDEIAWLGLGAAPDVDGLLSAFGREVVGLRSFLERPAGKTLVLIDEFARTTSPREGRALLVALLETLRARGALALAATHLTGIAAAAGAAHYALGGLGALARSDGAPLDLEHALARIAAAMDYRLARVAEGAVPQAQAVALAEALGLDEELVARAKAAL